MRTERYKLIHYYEPPEEFELYDLKEDPGELHNLYGEPALCRRGPAIFSSVSVNCAKKRATTTNMKNQPMVRGGAPDAPR